ncbi:MAG TPA: hypothetical protein PKV13_01770 [Propionicimonas sp.]|nr:hypothetical protein [Propionicimonas sp.]HRA05333.1 hypothetical protein [Propionicimonas sp.]
MFSCLLLLTDEGARMATYQGGLRLSGRSGFSVTKPDRVPLPPRGVGEVLGQFRLRFEAVYRGRPADAGPAYEVSAWTMTPTGGRVVTSFLLAVCLEEPFPPEPDWDVSRFGLKYEIEKYGRRLWRGSLPITEFSHATVGIRREVPPGTVERTYAIPVEALPSEAALRALSDTVPLPAQLAEALPADALSMAAQADVAAIRSIDDAQRVLWARYGPGWRRGTFAISGVWFEDAESYVLSCGSLEWLRDQDRRYFEPRRHQVVDKQTGQVTPESADADSPLADRLSRATRHDDGPWAELW